MKNPFNKFVLPDIPTPDLKMPAAKRYGHFVVYALCDPTSKKVHYVGRSKRPKNRLTQHINEALKDRIQDEDLIERLFGDGSGAKVERVDKEGKNSRKLAWLNKLSEHDLSPLFIILDEWDCETLSDANRLEEAWIAEMFRRHEPLTNRITSHRMLPRWYDKTRKGWKPGYSQSPMEYIERLKAGLVKPKNPVSKIGSAKVHRRKLARYRRPASTNKNNNRSKKPKR